MLKVNYYSLVYFDPRSFLVIVTSNQQLRAL